MKSEEEIAMLAAEAHRVWNSPVVVDFMENYVKKLFIDWTNAQTAEEQNELWHASQGAAAFKAAMMSHMAAGRTLEKQKAGGISDGVGPII